MNNVPHWASEWLACLKRSRDRHAERGYDVSRVTIGYYDGLVRACDDDGAYDVRLGSHGNTVHQSVGGPSKTLESIFYCRDIQ